MPQIGIWISELQEAYICREVNAGRSFEINYEPGSVLSFGESGLNAAGEIARIVFLMRGDTEAEECHKTGAVVALGCYTGVVLPAAWAESGRVSYELVHAARQSLAERRTRPAKL